jgi:hypothetical protein
VEICSSSTEKKVPAKRKRYEEEGKADVANSSGMDNQSLGVNKIFNIKKKHFLQIPISPAFFRFNFPFLHPFHFVPSSLALDPFVQ